MGPCAGPVPIAQHTIAGESELLLTGRLMRVDMMLEWRLGAPPASLPRCSVEPRRFRHAVPFTYATAVTPAGMPLHLGVRRSLCAVNSRLASERMKEHDAGCEARGVA